MNRDIILVLLCRQMQKQIVFLVLLKPDVSEMTFSCFRLNLNNNFYDKLVSFFSFSFFWFCLRLCFCLHFLVPFHVFEFKI